MKMPRMSGAVTGNFGRAKVKARPGTLDISKEVLRKDNLRIPREEEAIARYIEAYNNTNDPKLQAGLMEMIRNYYNKQVNNKQYKYTFDITYVFGGDEHQRQIDIIAANQQNAEKILTNKYTCRRYTLVSILSNY